MWTNPWYAYEPPECNCDVCGAPVTDYWSEVECDDSGYETEYCAPLDLCDRHIAVFATITEHYKVDPNRHHGLSPMDRYDLIQVIRDKEFELNLKASMV